MRIECFRDIIEYSNKNRKYMEEKVFDFYKDVGMDMNNTIRNFLQLVRTLFLANNYLVLEIPFKDQEIGALCYKGDSMGYTFLNTSLPKVNVNFALCHEVYHVFYQESGFEHKVELYMNEQYYEHEEELAANLFAGMVLMPEHNFKYMFNKFENEAKEDDSIISVLAKLMNYFEVPYTAVLIRCYELKLLEAGDLLKDLLSVEKELIKKEFSRLWLEEDILQATKKDDFEKFAAVIQTRGAEYLESGYINERTYRKALSNINSLYQQIKGE